MTCGLVQTYQSFGETWYLSGFF